MSGKNVGPTSPLCTLDDAGIDGSVLTTGCGDKHDEMPMNGSIPGPAVGQLTPFLGVDEGGEAVRLGVRGAGLSGEWDMVEWREWGCTVKSCLWASR